MSAVSAIEIDPEQADLYQVLGLSGSTALSAADIKAAYKRSLLLHHPDKKIAGAPGESFSIDAVSSAYKILSDAVLRLEYDEALAKQRLSGGLPEKFISFRTGLETVDLDDLTYDDQHNTWTKSCRCGVDGGFIVTEDELEQHAQDGELITGCRGCSLWLRILFSATDGASVRA